MQAGDFILVHGNGWFDKLIQFGQRFRYPLCDSYYNHAALVISEQGDLIEAIATGIKQTNISKYSTANCKIVQVYMSDEDRKEAVAYAKSCLHEGYGFLTFFSSTLAVLFGLQFLFGMKGQDICSGLVAKSLEHAGKIMPQDAAHMTPSDLAEWADQNSK